MLHIAYVHSMMSFMFRILTLILALLYSLNFTICSAEEDDDLWRAQEIYGPNIVIDDLSQCLVYSACFHMDIAVFDQCAKMFLDQLQDALRRDDTKALYKLFSSSKGGGRKFEWRRCRKKNACNTWEGEEKNLYHVFINTEKELATHYHALFNKRIKNFILSLNFKEISVYPGCMYIDITNNGKVWADIDFMLTIINDFK